MFLSVEVAKNPEADHASARWHSLPSGVPFLGPKGPCGYQVKPEARFHREPSTTKSVEAAVTQSFHLFGAFAGVLPVRPRRRRPVFPQGSAQTDGRSPAEGS